MARTERQSERRRKEVVDLLVLPRPAKNLQNGAGFSGKNLSMLGLPKKESGHSATKRTVGKYARTAFPKRKRAVSPENQIVR